MEDLVFGFGISPEEVAAMSIRRLHFWHSRAHAYVKRTKPNDGGR